MKFRRTLLIATLVAGVVLMSLAAGLLYLYRHPSMVIDWVVDGIRERTGLSVVVSNLQWSAQPLELIAEDVHILSTESDKPFETRIAHLKLNSRISGPFMRRTLVIDNLALNKFSIRLDHRFTLTGFEPVPSEPDFMAWLVRKFLFEKVQIKKVDLLSGTIRLTANSQVVDLYDINGYTEQLHRVKVSGKMTIDGLPKASGMQASDWNLDLELEDPEFIEARVILPSATLLGSMGRADLSDVQVQIGYDVPRQRLVISHFRLDSSQFELGQNEDGPRVWGPLSLAGSGVYDIRQHRVSLSEWSLAYRKDINGSGRAEINFDSDLPVKVDVTDGRLSAEALQDVLKTDFNLDLPVSLKGILTLSGDLQKTAGAGLQSWQARLTIELPDNRFAYKQPGAEISGALNGRIRVAGPLNGLKVEAKAGTRQTVVHTRFWHAEQINTEFTLSASHPLYRINHLIAGVPQGYVRHSDRTIGLKHVILKMAEADFDAQTGTFGCASIHLDSDLLKNLKAGLWVSRNAGRIDLKGIDSGLPAVVGKLKVMPAGWSIDASDRFTLSMQWNTDEPVTASGSGELVNLNFLNDAENCLGENLNWHTRFKARIEPTQRSVLWNISAGLNAGEVLCGKHYLDFEPNRLTVDGQGDWKTDRNAIRFSGLKLDLKDLVSIDLDGVLDAGGPTAAIKLDARIKADEISTVYDAFVRDPYQYELPIVNTIRIGGPVEADIHWHRKADRWQIDGAARWTDGGLAMPEKNVVLTGIDLMLPIWYTAGLRQQPSGRLNGRLSIDSLTVPFLPNQSLDVGLMAGANQLRIPASTQLQAESGNIVLGPLAIAFAHQKAPVLKTGLELSRVSASSLLKTVWQSAPAATVHGRLQTVSLKGRHLTSQGRLSVDAFGGQVHITNPGVRDVFSSTPAVYLNAAVEKLDLAQMTADTAFGKIEGALSGHVNRLQLVGVEPQQFDLRLETVKVKGTPQRINVRAVESIARLGGGASPFMGLAGTFATLLKTFPYRQIGVSASLRNDVFKINGTIKENQTEYLVRRSGLSGVDVVNLNPDNRISFKDMLKRIQRINSTAGGPVIR